MDKQYKVGVVGATGMVGQRFVTLLENHPWFKLTTLAASGRSAGKTYEEAVGSRWAMTTPMPESVKKMVVLDASKVEEVASQVDFIFCAVNMPKDEIKALEEAYAKAECPVVSNNSAHRMTPDVPMVVPEINADHLEIIPAQRKRLGTKLTAAAAEIPATEPEESMDIVREKHFALKPCSTEEAILQMDLLGHSFFLYHSTENDKIQVVYRRADGGYGVLIPEA